MTDESTQSAPVTASAAVKPCEMYRHTGGQRPSVTQGHHLHPIYLQNKVYGRIRDPELAYLCGTCHDNVHAWLYWIMGERDNEPNPIPPFRARRMADAAFAWYLGARADAA